MFSTASTWISNAKPIEVLITKATNPERPDSYNHAHHFEVVEYINQKKANTPRDAAMFVARIVNHRDTRIAMLALALLETLVQNCGYPFHLQISTKEFLNELVRRFPERPPLYPGPVMSRILELIHQWNTTICAESRYKEDLGNIRDMHRLLSFKGYRFRDLPRQASVPSASNLKSAEELEAEDREAQSAKLQELIRRGTPRDLAAAQELMKSLAGANPDAKPDYRTQALTELNKLESKVVLLNEMLDNVTEGERFVVGDVYDQVASILSAARPKIQGWISNAETDDPESLDTFLQINDQINSVLNRYESFKKGDYVAASNPIPSELSSTSRQQNDQSLIDFDDSVSPPSNTTSNAAPIDELASLFGPLASTSAPPPPAGYVPSYTPQAGTMSMSAMGSAFSSPIPAQHNGSGFHPAANAVMGTPGLVHSTRQSMISPSPPGTLGAQPGSPFGLIRLGTPQMQPQSMGAAVPPAPNYFSHPMVQNQFQQPAQIPQQPLRPQSSQPQPPATSQSQTQGKDPFADLAGLF